MEMLVILIVVVVVCGGLVWFLTKEKQEPEPLSTPKRWIRVLNAAPIMTLQIGEEFQIEWEVLPEGEPVNSGMVMWRAERNPIVPPGGPDKPVVFVLPSGKVIGMDSGEVNVYAFFTDTPLVKEAVIKFRVFSCILERTW
jgi:hypothetical protein